MIFLAMILLGVEALEEKMKNGVPVQVVQA